VISRQERLLLANRMTVVILRRMRYPPSHKQETRRRILEAASQAFRERGVAETGVDEIMRRSGLTHGGFYAHFHDKADLIAEACAAGFAEALPNLARIAALPTRAARARVLIDSYLSERHRDNRGSGCLIVAVAADMARLQGSARAGYSRAFLLHIERLAAALRLSDAPEENRARVTDLMSSLVGALLFARATDDPKRSSQMLQAARRRLRAEFCQPLKNAGDSSTSIDRKLSPSHDLLRPF
jgi:TetR/AcrR family transcriptional repressor of nem operon